MTATLVRVWSRSEELLTEVDTRGQCCQEPENVFIRRCARAKHVHRRNVGEGSHFIDKCACSCRI
jgi:hypothetical protein